MANNKKPESLDAAYERQAMQQGLIVSPVFTENKPGFYQPSPKRNLNPSVWDLTINDMLRRDKFGAEKYKTHLQPFNGRDALQDAYEEALDLCVYLRQALYERDKK